MGWKAAQAVDVEHMPLMIHTLCAVGRWWLPSLLPLPMSRMGLLSFFFSVLCFFPAPHMETSGKLKCVVYAVCCPCIMAILIPLQRWTEQNNQCSVLLLFSQTRSFLFYYHALAAFDIPKISSFLWLCKFSWNSNSSFFKWLFCTFILKS